MTVMTKYFVHVTTDDPPIHYDKGYDWPNVKAFARIGTQKRKDGTWSEDRVITRGLRGPIVRIYHHGQREWPVYASQVNMLRGKKSLTSKEMPKKLVFEDVGDDRYHTVVVKKVGQSYRAIPKSEPWRSRFLKQHPSW